MEINSYHLFSLNKTLLIIFAILLHTFHIKAVTVTWDGSAGDSLWDNPTNWDTGLVPVAGDDVIISNGDKVEVTSNSACRSISLSSAGSNLMVNANLTLTGSTTDAIFIGTGTTVENAGHISVTNVSDTGIGVAGILSNTATGTIDISMVIGFTSFGILNGGTIENEGEIHFTNCDGRGLSNGGIVQNEGLISAGLIGSSAVLNSLFGIFDNEVTGRIIVVDSSFRSAENNGRMINRGLMRLTGYSVVGFRNDGYFENYDSLIVRETLGTGVINGDTLINKMTGVIVTELTAGSGGIDNQDNGPLVYFLNEGMISLTEGGRGIKNEARFENSGTINIIDMMTFGISATDNIFFNLVDGIISISMITNASGQGIVVGPVGTVQNAGQVDLINIIGSGIVSTGGILQTSTGNLTMNSVTSDLLMISSSNNFEVNGIFSIDN